ncbi:MAG TPA: hypothetical protein VJY34_20440 [Roseiarcus sp.]|nr:hypothetical protein [Roseiarcus sp.]
MAQTVGAIGGHLANSGLCHALAQTHAIASCETRRSFCVSDKRSPSAQAVDGGERSHGVFGIEPVAAGLFSPFPYGREDHPMKKFLVLYMADSDDFEDMMKNSTPEQQKKGMDAWMKWMGDNKASLVDGGAPLGKTKRVDEDGASDTKNDVGGYSIVQAESADAATELFDEDHPHLQMPGAWIEIIEIMQVPGM